MTGKYIMHFESLAHKYLGPENGKRNNQLILKVLKLASAKRMVSHQIPGTSYLTRQNGLAAG